MDENMTLLIDPETRDLVFDDSGNFVKIYDADTNEVEDIIREAIFQENDVARIDSITVSYNRRSVTAEFTATLVSGETIALGVTA